MRTLSIVGTRPEILRLQEWEKEILFTGQHFDWDMGQRFISNLTYPRNGIHYLPANIDHSNIDTLVAEIIKKIEAVGAENPNNPVLQGLPDIILVHGDTRSALAGALAAHQMKILLAHTEAGVRCFQDTVEEKIRKQIDHIANYNFCPTPQAVENLRKVGISDGVYFVGDTLYDEFLRLRESWDFVFVTIHRAENIENEGKLRLLIDSLKDYPHVVFPIHPHTRKCLEKFNIELPGNILELPPLDHKETLRYIRDAKLVLTDSGGIEREAFWSGTPCKVAREKTEWSYYTGAFGNGHAGERMRTILETKQPFRRVV